MSEPTWGQPGLFQNIPFEQYAALPAVNNTLLQYFCETPADAKAFLDGGGETSDALEFGIGAHCLMLEPVRFEEQFAIGPDVKLNTKEGKEAWGAFLRSNPGKRPIRGAAGAEMLGMRKALFDHPLASKILTCEGMNEVTLIWRDKETNLLMKCRLDRHLAWEGATAVADYKTARCAARRHFARAYWDCKYFMQEAIYRDGTEAVIGEAPEHFFFIAQEKNGIYRANVFEFPEERVEQGRQLYRRLLRAYAECKEQNFWPAVSPLGYDYDIRVIHEDVPEYMTRSLVGAGDVED